MAEPRAARPVLVLQHHPVETPGVFLDVLAERGLAARTVRSDLGEPVPAEPSAFAALVVMGGPMGVYEEDRHPWIRDEVRLLAGAVDRDVPTLGVCLGSQLVAKAAGARVAPGPEKEIGWYPLTLTPDGRADALLGGLPPAFEAFEWHGDVFDLPPGAAGLVRSARYPYQAFRLGRRVYGLLFHLEVTAPMVRGMVEAFRGELAGLGDPSRAAAILAGLEARTTAMNRLARGLFERFLDLTDPEGRHA